jgi:hypothetical protein
MAWSTSAAHCSCVGGKLFVVLTQSWSGVKTPPAYAMNACIYVWVREDETLVGWLFDWLGWYKEDGLMMGENHSSKKELGVRTGQSALTFTAVGPK